MAALPTIGSPLRGGVAASQYKDYILTLLFMKYVSDKAATDPDFLIEIPDGGSFAELVSLKGDKEIGDKINKIIARLAEADSGKSGVPGVNRNDLHKLQVVLPPLPEQRLIATALSDVDDLIHSLDKLIAKKRAIKKGTMQQLLTGKTRLPGFQSGKRSKESDMGTIPVDWQVMLLRHCLLNPPSYGINAAAVRFTDGLPTYLRITDIAEDGRFRPSPRVSVENPDAGKFFLDEGDLVFARTGASVGKSYLYDPGDGPLVFAGFLIRLSPDPATLEPSFLAYFVQTQRYWDWVATVSARSGQPGINSVEYGMLPIALPGKREQNAIATILSDMDAEITALERRRDKTKQIKLGMMQQLLTGRVRLVKPLKVDAGT